MTRLVWILIGVCAVLLAFELVADRYGPFAVEHVFGFYASSASSPRSSWCW
jgi:hypothetical protein